MTLTWENGHIRADFCEDLGRHRLVDPWNGADKLLLLPIARPGRSESLCAPRTIHAAANGDALIAPNVTNGHRYDVVLDLVGNRSLTDLRRALTPNGTLVLSGGGVYKGGSLIGPLGLFIRGLALSRFIRQRVVAPQAMPSRENLATLRELAESGKLTPIIDRTYPLSEVPEAVRYVETEHTRAKVVITV